MEINKEGEKRIGVEFYRSVSKSYIAKVNIERGFLQSDQNHYITDDSMTGLLNQLELLLLFHYRTIDKSKAEEKEQWIKKEKMN